MKTLTYAFRFFLGITTILKVQSPLSSNFQHMDAVTRKLLTENRIPKRDSNEGRKGLVELEFFHKALIKTEWMTRLVCQP